jgi:hypothetical protein
MRVGRVRCFGYRHLSTGPARAKRLIAIPVPDPGRVLPETRLPSKP